MPENISLRFSRDLSSFLVPMFFHRFFFHPILLQLARFRVATSGHPIYKAATFSLFEISEYPLISIHRLCKYFTTQRTDISTRYRDETTRARSCASSVLYSRVAHQFSLITLSMSERHSAQTDFSITNRDGRRLQRGAHRCGASKRKKENFFP